jgi:hypothetical protein
MILLFIDEEDTILYGILKRKMEATGFGYLKKIRDI